MTGWYYLARALDNICALIFFLASMHAALWLLDYDRATWCAVMAVYFGMDKGRGQE